MKQLLGILLAVVLLAVAGSAIAARDTTTNEVTITVLNAAGSPVADASVRAWSDTYGHFQPWERYQVSKTDANGQVKFKFVVGEWSIFACADGMYLAAVHHKVAADTKAITIKPDSTVTIEGQDPDGTLLNDAEIHMYTVEHRPVVPMMVVGKMMNGKATIATIGRQTYGVMLVRQPTDERPGLALHWDRVIGSYAFKPNREWLRKLTLHARALDGGPGEMETRISFPELTCVFDFRGNPGEFTVNVKGTATLLMEPAYVEVESIIRKDGWMCRYFPTFVDLQKEAKAEMTFGGLHTIVPRVYAREGYLSATWLKTTDAYDHISYEIKNPENKLPPLTFNFRDGNGNRLYGDVEGGQWAPAIRFTKDLTPDVVSFDGVIDYGPFGKRAFSGDPRSEEFACNVERIVSNAHFELMCAKDPQFKPQLEAMLLWMENVYHEYESLWGLRAYLADKPTTVYFEPNLSNAIGGLSYGNKMINAWQTDLLDFTEPRLNALCHMQNIMCHEYFHTCQSIPEMKWGGRSLYPSTWIGESFPQVGFNRVYERYYGPVVATMHKGLYLSGIMKNFAGEKGYGNKEWVWEEIAADSGDLALRRGHELLGDKDWRPWDWMIKSGYDVPVALMAMFKVVTGKNYAYAARQAGEAAVTDEVVEQAYALIQSGKSPFPEVVTSKFMTKWLILGPIDDTKRKFVPEEATPGEATLSPKAGEELLGKKWTEFTSTAPDGLIDLIQATGGTQNVGAYGFTTFNSTKAGKGYIWLGTDDGAMVYLNGKQVYLKDIPQGATADQYVVPIELREGENMVLIKVNQGDGAWGFYMRVSDTEGKSVEK